MHLLVATQYTQNTYGYTALQHFLETREVTNYKEVYTQIVLTHVQIIEHCPSKIS